MRSVTAIVLMVLMLLITPAWCEDIVHGLTVIDSRIKDGRVETETELKRLRKYDHLVMISWQYKTFKKEANVSPASWPGIEMGPIVSTGWGRGMDDLGDKLHEGKNVYRIPFGSHILLSGEVTHVRMMITSIVSRGKIEDDPHPSTITAYSKWFPVDQVRAMQQKDSGGDPAARSP